MKMPPIIQDTETSDWALNVNTKIAPLIPGIAKDLGLPSDHVIDIYGKLGGDNYYRPEYYCDG